MVCSYLFIRIYITTEKFLVWKKELLYPGKNCTVCVVSTFYVSACLRYIEVSTIYMVFCRFLKCVVNVDH